FPAARRALGELIEDAPDSRALTIMAAIERGEGASDQVVKGWLARALNAPRGPQWVCGNCHNIHTEWVPVCENCQAFDTLEWKAPPAAEVQSATGVAMLPLIVGALENQSAPEEPEEEPTPPVVDAEIIDDPSEVDAPPQEAK
ncbi:MAG: heme biosynthesis protein HemY, partial [Rhodobacteraceae bacterium]|nr:heme biosynthesis protein HemY [Paracoccaceae bacterium]